MRLIAERGYRDAHIADIASEAGVSVRTVHVHYPSKEAIVFGDADIAIAELSEMLEAAEISPLDALRGWVAQITPTWLEPEVRLQRQLADEFPSVDRERERLLTLLRRTLAEGFAREFDAEAGSPDARFAAAVAADALDQIESSAAASTRQGRKSPDTAQFEEIIDCAARFIERARKET